MEEPRPPLILNDLPYDCLHQIFSYMSYHEIAHCRLICRNANAVCHTLLSSGAENLRLKINRIQTKLKAQLPRRESARRGHVASDLLEVVNSVENRVSIIRLALDRYLITGQLTFFPGKVLDEAFRITAHIESLAAPVRDGSPPTSPFSAMQKVAMLRDLRDLSTMASEHIDDVILPNLRNRSPTNEPIFKFGQQRLILPCRASDLAARVASPEKSATFRINSSGFNSPSSSSSSENSDDPVIRLCGLFVDQFRSVTAHMDELKNQNKSSQNKMTQLTAEVNALKQMLTQEQLFSASLAKKIEVTETALAEMRRLTMNVNGTAVPHLCESSTTTIQSKRKSAPKRQYDNSESSDLATEDTSSKKAKGDTADHSRRLTRASCRRL